MSELEFFLLKGVLPQNSNTMELIKFLDKYQKLHIQIEAATLKVISCKTISKYNFWKKNENLRFCEQNKLLFKHPALQPLGNFNHMAACRSSIENTRKLCLQLVLNKNSPWIHMESELNVLGIAGKLVKYVVHLCKEGN
jgi:hypothetical protein